MAVGEWDQRQLCSDGSCVGVIGPDGTCKVCGRAAQNWGDERKRGLIEPADDEAEAPADDALEADADAEADDDGYDEDEDAGEDDLDDDEDLDEGEAEDDGEDDLHDVHEVAPLAASASASLPAAPVDWGTRRLCPDGSCIGLIGADGRCKVCGRAATSAPTNGEAAPASAGFTIVTTEAAVETTDEAVQTTASTVKTGEPAPSDPAAHTAADDDPDSKDPER